jgi:hypothetical protein
MYIASITYYGYKGRAANLCHQISEKTMDIPGHKRSGNLIEFGYLDLAGKSVQEAQTELENKYRVSDWSIKVELKPLPQINNFY